MGCGCKKTVEAPAAVVPATTTATTTVAVPTVQQTSQG